MRRVHRATLFFSLFIGLLFSAGEGIRLLPFPYAEDAAAAIVPIKPLARKSLGVVSHNSAVKSKCIEREREADPASFKRPIKITTGCPSFKGPDVHSSPTAVSLISGFPDPKKGRAPPLSQIATGILPESGQLRLVRGGLYVSDDTYSRRD